MYLSVTKYVELVLKCFALIYLGKYQTVALYVVAAYGFYGLTFVLFADGLALPDSHCQKPLDPFVSLSEREAFRLPMFVLLFMAACSSISGCSSFFSLCLN